MNKIERVAAAIRGGQTDHVPVSFWGHDFLREWSAEGLAEAMIENYRRHDWDFIKVNPRASYQVEDWGAIMDRPDDPNVSPKFLRFPVRYPDDWRRFRPLSPDRGVLGEHLKALRIIGAELNGAAYFVHTVFSPLSVAEYLAGRKVESVKESMSGYRKSLESALDMISETFVEYALACIDAGASGIYFATTGWAAEGRLREDEYRTFGMPYDLRILEAVAGKAPFHVLHNCGPAIHFELLAGYPVAAISWDASLPGNPSLAEGKRRTDKAVMGGVSEKTTLPDGTPEQVAEEVIHAIQETGGRRILIAPGCSIPPKTPPANLEAAARAVRHTKV